MRRCTLVLWLGLIAAAGWCAWAPAGSVAQDKEKQEKQDKPGSYVKPKNIDYIRILPPPPPSGSPEERIELEFVLLVQSRRTSADVERLKAHEKVRLDSFADILGRRAQSGAAPQLEALLKRVEKDSKQITEAAKEHFKRQRPPRIDQRLQPVLKLDDEPSYPSGHATRGMLFARLLADLAPEHEAALLRRGQEIGWSRVEASLHFPSDVQAGRTLGQAIAHYLLRNTEFQIEWRQVRTEWTALTAK
ncbi:MAG TPA: phosphatase PAP2 family protein [Gemmatales bacterium]|mgnify:CR=1 FL=1|nr:phosphatase PAP2 family protein [Gemmatales bacterium]HMP58271.1 phosphatase PAP2 family protein [Gemmatales bacterium]